MHISSTALGGRRHVKHEKCPEIVVLKDSKLTDFRWNDKLIILFNKISGNMRIYGT